VTKGSVALLNRAESFINDDIPNLITGQAKKELSAVASSVVNVITKGKGGKAEVDFIKGEYDGISSYTWLQKGGAEKIANADAGWDAQSLRDTKEILQNDKKAELKTRQPAFSYVDTKSGGHVQSLLNAPKTIPKTITNEKTRNVIRKLPNGKVKQAVAYGNGAIMKGDGTFFGFEQYLSDKNINKK